ncbi:F-box/LRR-repeat protein At5g63520-like isoform X2 [Carica papaya]|uniref:F-box/LRR-repeat protein At5g63520-like isoform X2 n=1 Tax=Carica papaya TaxID=3649 RepID=UPI000B8D0F8C|nr:F-box/LRR-repeat protein At5g63520-like isoform X2 [Carica papaya]
MRNQLRKKMGGFFSENDDIFQNILSRLPALSFASAACVNKSWYNGCGRILSRPKLVSALSCNPSLHLAVREVVDKVLLEPIWPHFAIAFIGTQFNLQAAHQLITERLGSRTPTVTSAVCGIIGMDACTDELREVKWDFVYPGGPNGMGLNAVEDLDYGIVLAVGFFPGLKFDVIPLLRPKGECQGAMVDKFVMDIREYATTVSGTKDPAGIILFGDQRVDVKAVIAELDIGEIQFHVAMSTGIIPFGPELRVVSVEDRGAKYSWFTAKMEGGNGTLDAQGLLDDVVEQVEDHLHNLYVGVVKERESSSGSENLELRKYRVFHEVLGGEDGGFVVDGHGIEPNDSFLFYHTDSETAKCSCFNAYKNLGHLKEALSLKNHDGGGGAETSEVFGCVSFSCYRSGERFFGHPKVLTYPFWKNFPGTPLIGAYCLEEIGRETEQLVSQKDEGAESKAIEAMGEKYDDEEECSVRCPMHVYSSVYLLMSYIPPGSPPLEF